MKAPAWAPVAAVLLGVLFGLALLLGGPLLIYILVAKHLGAGNVDGETAWREEAADWNAEQWDRDAKARALGLTARYEVHPFCGDIREVLYGRKDFGEIERRLETLFENLHDPLEAHRYSQTVARLTYLDHDSDPAAMLAAIEAWAAASPASYRALMVRGMMHIRYGIYYRGDGYAFTMSRASARGMQAEMKLARADLEAACDLFQGDPEAWGALGSVARYLGEGQEKIAQFHDRAQAICPLSLSARVGRLYAALPQWGGSWEKVDAVITECEEASEQFPLLLVVKREAEREMYDRSDAHHAALNSPDKRREWVDPYLLQLDLTPGEALLKTHAAYYAYRSDDMVLADRLFRELGDHFHEGAKFRDLLEYNDFRGNACAGSAYTLPPGPERMEGAREAFEIAPNHYYTNYFLGTELIKAGDFANAKKHLENSLAAKPDYGWAMLRLGEVAEHLQQPAEAARHARAVIALRTGGTLGQLAEDMLKRNK